MGVHRDWSHETDLAVEKRSASRARAFVSRYLLHHGLAHLEQDMRLVVSELATNAMVHARTPFTVRLGASGDTVMLEVLDGSQTRPTVGGVRQSDTSGRGLSIVRALSREWGVSVRAAGGKSVWAAFDVAGAPPRRR